MVISKKSIILFCRIFQVDSNKRIHIDDLLHHHCFINEVYLESIKYE